MSKEKNRKPERLSAQPTKVIKEDKRTEHRKGDIMSKENTDTISILTIQTEVGGEAQTMFPSFTKVMAKYSQIVTEKLGESLSEFIKTLSRVIETLPESNGGYTVDTLTFSLSVDGTGKISLIGELSAGVTSGITLTIKKRKVSKS